MFNKPYASLKYPCNKLARPLKRDHFAKEISSEPTINYQGIVVSFQWWKCKFNKKRDTNLSLSEKKIIQQQHPFLGHHLKIPKQKSPNSYLFKGSLYEKHIPPNNGKFRFSSHWFFSKSCVTHWVLTGQIQIPPPRNWDALRLVNAPAISWSISNGTFLGRSTLSRKPTPPAP